MTAKRQETARHREKRDLNSMVGTYCLFILLDVFWTLYVDMQMYVAEVYLMMCVIRKTNCERMGKDSTTKFSV